MDPKVLNNRPNHKTRTKPNLIGMGNTLKGKGNNKRIHKPNTLALPTPNAERKLRPKPINHSQSQPNPLPLTQPLTHPKDTSPLTHPKNTSSPTQSPTKEVPKTMNTSDQCRWTTQIKPNTTLTTANLCMPRWIPILGSQSKKVPGALSRWTTSSRYR